MLCLIVASGFFSGSETALFYLSQEDVRRMRVGNSRERAAAALLSDPDRLLTAVLFWNLLINLLYFAVSVVVAQRLARHGQNAAAGVFGLFGLFTIIVLGEVLPKSLAVVLRRRLATLVSWPLAAAVRVLDPVTPTLGKITRIARRTFWPHIRHETWLDAEDLERAVDASRHTEEVVRHERQVLHNVLDLSEISVEEVMRPRGTYGVLYPPVRLADLRGRAPVVDYILIGRHGETDIDRAVRLTAAAALTDDNLEAIAEEVLHVPWCANLAYTLQLFRDRDRKLAAVVNEYGEDVGIITYEDVIDTIFTPVPSRARRMLNREPIEEVAPGEWRIEGITTLRYFCRWMGVEFEPTTDGMVTIAGMLHEELEHIPEVGDECVWRDFRFRVSEVLPGGAIRARAVRTATEDSPPETEPQA